MNPKKRTNNFGFKLSTDRPRSEEEKQLIFNCLLFLCHVLFVLLNIILSGAEKLIYAIFVYILPLVLLNLNVALILLLRYKPSLSSDMIKWIMVSSQNLNIMALQIHLIELTAINQSGGNSSLLVSLWVGSHWSLNTQTFLKFQKQNRVCQLALLLCILFYPIVRGATLFDFSYASLSVITIGLFIKEEKWIDDRLYSNDNIQRSLADVSDNGKTKDFLSNTLEKKSQISMLKLGLLEGTPALEELPQISTEILNALEESVVVLSPTDNPIFYNESFEQNFGPVEDFKMILKERLFIVDKKVLFSFQSANSNINNSFNNNVKARPLQHDSSPLKSINSMTSNISLQKSKKYDKGPNLSIQDHLQDSETLEQFIEISKKRLITKINSEPETYLQLPINQGTFKKSSFHGSFNQKNLDNLFKGGGGVFGKKFVNRQKLHVELSQKYFSRASKTEKFELELIFFVYNNSKNAFQNNFDNLHYVLKFQKRRPEPKEISRLDTKDFDDLKVKMLSSISHELRTPLNCSINMLELLLNSMGKDSSFIDLLMAALNNCKLLQTTIDDILDYSSMMANTFKLKVCTFSLKEIINEGVSLISYSAKERSNTIEVRFGNKELEEIKSDPERIKQIFMNLLLNANKYTSNGKIVVDVTKVDEEVVRISVRDTGLGIRSSVLKKLGVLNGLGENNLIGLGLTISNYIHSFLAPPEHPNISFKTEEGKGSQFTFWVLQKKGLPVGPGSKEPNIPDSKIKAMKLLQSYCVSDNNENTLKIGARTVKSSKSHSCIILSPRDKFIASPSDLNLKNVEKEQGDDEDMESCLEEEALENKNTEFKSADNLFCQSSVFNTPKIVLDRLNTFQKVFNQKSSSSQQTNRVRNLGNNELRSVQSEEEGPTVKESSLSAGTRKSGRGKTEILGSIGSQSLRSNIAYSLQERKRAPSSEIKLKPQLLNVSARSEVYRFGSPAKLSKTEATSEIDSKFENTKSQNLIKLDLKGILQIIQEGKACDCHHILLVDDNGYNLMVLRLMIEALGMKSDQAISGDEALNKVRIRQEMKCGCGIYKIIFMDLDMPVKDGFVTTSEILEMLKLNNLEERRSVIIACTAFNENEFGDRCKDCGMMDFISKPVSKVLLEKKLVKYLSKFIS